MEEWMIKTSNLCKKYKGQKVNAVNDLNLSVAKGQLFGLIGPDGSGKTTTFRMLSTVMESSSGDIRIAGFDAKKETERIRSNIGYMPQNFSLYPDLSVQQNLDFFADINRVPHHVKTERIQYMLEFTRLSGFEDRQAGRLSGGMKKKLGLACSLVHSPQIVLLDEPSTGVDPVSRRELWMILGQVVQQGVTVLVSTPYMDEAERCHQIAILNRGEILLSGTPADLERNLPFDVLEVNAKPRKEMRRVIGLCHDILDWRPVGDRLRVSVPQHKSDAVLHFLQEAFQKNNLEIRLLRKSKATMEDVFVHTASDQRSEA